MRQMVSLLLALTMLMGYQGVEVPDDNTTEPVEAVGMGYPLCVDPTEETEPVAAVACAEVWWLLDRNGKLLEQAATPEGYATISGLTLLAPEAGTYLVTPGNQVQRVAWLRELLSALQDWELTDRLEHIDLPEEHLLTFTLDGRFTVHISPTLDEGMNYWIRRLRAALDSSYVDADKSYTVEILDGECLRFIPN